MLPLNKRQWRFLRVVAVRVAPPVAGLDTAGAVRFEAIVGKALADRSPALVRQLRLLLALLRWAPLLRFGVRFERLSPARQDAVLRLLLDAPIAKLRAGFWGLRALVFMGYYGQPETWPAVRYAPSLDGNERLRV